jgi:hypothetical protein
VLSLKSRGFWVLIIRGVCRLIRVGVLPVLRCRSRVLVAAYVLAQLAEDTAQGVSW